MGSSGMVNLDDFEVRSAFGWVFVSCDR
jgi:hypothetical protein